MTCTIKEYKTGIILNDIKHFGLTETLDNGSAFRWNKINKDRYVGIVNNKALQIVKINDNALYIDNLTIQEFNNYFLNYFDINYDYDTAYSVLLQDPQLNMLIPNNTPLRLLKQDFVESFIGAYISQNNNIPRIKLTIENICRRYGNDIKYRDVVLKSFPILEQLKDATESDFKELGLGYRAKGLSLAIDRLYTLEKAKGDLNNYFNDFSYSDLKYYLLDFKGIGNKVADFIIAMTGICKDYCEAFIIDVWIKRAMKDLYDLDMDNLLDIQKVDEMFGQYKALAQQNIFHYYRSIYRNN